MARTASKTGGREATTAVIPGRYALSVGLPDVAAPPGWKWEALSSVAKLESGHTPSRKHPEYWGGSIPWIGIRDATSNHGRTIYETAEYTNTLGIENSSARVLPAGTVCLSRTASVGYVIVMGRQMATSQDFVNWVCADALNPHFLKYVLLSEREALQTFAVGSVHQTIYFPEVKAFHVCMPGRGEQDGIVDILGGIDDKVELNRRMNLCLEATARAIFKDWFVDFGPTRAKADRRPAYLASDLWGLFPDRLDAEGNPLGWRTGCLDELIVLQRGFDLPNDQRAPGPYVVMAASGPNGFHNQFMVAGPGVTTGRSGVLGNVFFIHEDFWPLNTSLWVKEFKGSSPVHAYFLLQTLNLASFNAGSAVPTLNRNHIHNVRVPIPSEAVVKAFDEIVMPLFKRLRMNVLESNTLVTTRDLLLPRLVSGETRVKSVETSAGAVL